MNDLENQILQSASQHPIDVRMGDEFFLEDIKFRGLAENIQTVIEMVFEDDKFTLSTHEEKLKELKETIKKMELLTQYIRRQNEYKYKQIQDIEALTARCRNMEDLIFEKQTT